MNINLDLTLSAYDYDLPESFIASRPLEKRDESRLLIYEKQSGRVTHTSFKDIPQWINPSLLVLNQSKVFPARLIGKKTTGGEVELFLLSLIQKNNLYPIMLKCAGKKREKDQYHFAHGLIATLELVDEDGSFWASFNTPDLLPMLEKVGQIPIPPYIRKGVADEKDKVQYQTVYAGETGSVAAPTAGLHFTPELLQSLKNMGVDQAYLSLHVGVGTFKPVQKENILEHKMHSEFYSIDKQNAEKIKANFGNLIAVGTTSMRAIQASVEGGEFKVPGDSLRSTDIFLYPGKEIYGMKGLITNFHLPKSSLLMLVSCLIGREKTLELYEIAKKENYRFFSYGDAMLILL